MCGICGHLGPADHGALEGMNALLAHRGPDSQGLWRNADGRCGLAMRRLAIIDLDTGDQPVASEDGRLICVFNGEIYNFRELRSELAARGHRFATEGDTEVLVHGFEEYGEALPGRLEGMFAFAIFDTRSGSLFLARDRLGIKPLFYHRRPGGLVFASEAKAVLSAMDDAPRIDASAVLRHLIIGFRTTEGSMFRGVEELPPGGAMTAGPDGLVVRRYWRLDPQAAGTMDMPLDEAAGRVREALAEAVRSHMVSDVPVGLSLSGGLDSSALAVFMRRASPEGLRAFTMGYGLDDDEYPYARSVARGEGFELTEFRRAPGQAMQDLPDILWHLEEPLSNVTAITCHQWARDIASQVKVTLVGEGADELFGGYLQYRLFAGLPGLAPGPVTRRLFRLAYLQPPMGLVRRLVGHDAGLAREAERIHRDEYLGAIPGGRDGLTRILGFDQAFELANNQLLRIDRLTMAHGLEARVPYLDHRLVELAWSLPARMKIMGRNQKAVLRRAVADLLPREVVQRPKTGRGGSQALFPALFGNGFEAMARTLLEDRENPVWAWFSRRAVDELLDGRSGQYPVLGRRVRDKTLYFLTVLGLWARLYERRPESSRQPTPRLAEMLAA